MNKQDVIDHIRHIIALNSGMSGAALTNHLRTKWPDYSPQLLGFKTLRSFIEECLPDISVVGKTGLDPIYGVSPDAPQTCTKENLWRIWSSPNSPYALIVEVDSGSVSSISATAATPTGTIRLDAPSADDHRSIARDFLKIQFPGTESDLSSLISDSPQWWQKWLKEIKKRGLWANWGGFRFNRLLSQFESTLNSHNIAGPVRDSALIQIRANDKSSTTPDTPAPSNGPKSTEIDDLRRLAISAIASMNEAELRELRFPLGTLMPVVRRKN